jgi:uncharacterized protein (TIGR02265 family)
MSDVLLNPEPAQIYTQSIEGLFLNAYGSRLTPQIKQSVKAAGIDLDAPLKPSYPPETYYAAVEALRRALFPSEGDQEAYKQMGRAFVAGFFQTFVGKVIAGMLRVVGPSRNLERVPRGLAAGSNFMKAEVQRVGEREYMLKLNDHGASPYFMQGVVESALQVSGAKDIEVELASRTGRTVEYRITWK